MNEWILCCEILPLQEAKTRISLDRQSVSHHTVLYIHVLVEDDDHRSSILFMLCIKQSRFISAAKYKKTCVFLHGIFKCLNLFVCNVKNKKCKKLKSKCIRTHSFSLATSLS